MYWSCACTGMDGWMDVKQRKIYFQNNLMFKCIHGLASGYLTNYILMAIEVSGINTHSHDRNVYFPFPDKELSKKQINV